MAKHSSKIEVAFVGWYEALPRYRDKLPAGGTLAGALSVLDRLKKRFDLDIDSHTAQKGKSQIAGAGGANLKRILKEFGEERPFLSEGGRTNRGLRGSIELMLNALSGGGLERLPEAERNQTLRALQSYVVEQIQERHRTEKLKLNYDPALTTEAFIGSILNVAQATGKEPAVAEYLVGAKLQLRFPTAKIENKRSSTADKQSGRAGDFQIEDSAFHVTTRASTGVFDRCKQNIDRGLSPILLVPSRIQAGAKDIAADAASGRISVRAIEEFVAQNIDEMGSFSASQRRKMLKQLLEKYNERVAAVEPEQAFLIEIPPNLTK